LSFDELIAMSGGKPVEKKKAKKEKKL